MIRGSVVPLALLALVFVAFAASAWAMADGNDLGGVYFGALALVALRVQTRMAEGAA